MKDFSDKSKDFRNKYEDISLEYEDISTQLSIFFQYNSMYSILIP